MEPDKFYYIKKISNACTTKYGEYLLELMNTYNKISLNDIQLDEARTFWLQLQARNDCI